DPESPDRRHAARVRARGLRRRGSGKALRRHAQRVPLRRASAWRPRAWHRPHRDASRAGAEPARSHCVPHDAERRGPPDERTLTSLRQAATRAPHQNRGAANEVTTKRINIPEEGVETLFGSYDENLKHLQARFNVSIRTQGHELFVDGEPPGVDNVE